MKRYTCWSPEAGETEDPGKDFDANGPEFAAEAFAEFRDDQAGEGCDGIHIIHVRGPDGELTRVRVKGEMVPTYDGEVIDG